MTYILDDLRSVRDVREPGSAEHNIFDRAVREIERLRALRTFQDQVAEFHRALDFPVREVPTVPPDDEVRLRARLISEEHFEVLGAMFPDIEWASWRDSIRRVIAGARVQVDLVELAHELADLHYVDSGTAVQLGIGEADVFAEVHRANLEKRGGGKDPGGKALKPDWWRPADVAAVLRAQGWNGDAAEVE